MAQNFSSTDVQKPISVVGFDALVFTLFGFAALTTIVRVYLWTFILRSGVLDNVLITIGTLLSFVITMLGHYGVVEMNYLSKFPSPRSVDSSGGSGMGLFDRYNQLYRYGKIASLIYLITLPVVKCAILAFYRKIVVGKKSLYFLYVVAFVIVGQGVGNFTASLVTGIRSKTIWNILEGDSQVPMNTTHQIINSCFQIFFDLVLLAIPIPILRRLKIRKSAKVGLVIIYILSFVSLAASIIRLHNVIVFFHSAALSSGALVAEYTYWTIIEVHTAIFCANLPALSSLLRMVVGYIKSSKQQRIARERAHAQRDRDKITPFSKLHSSRFWPSSMRSTNIDTITELEGSKKNLAANSVTSLPV